METYPFPPLFAHQLLVQYGGTRKANALARETISYSQSICKSYCHFLPKSCKSMLESCWALCRPSPGKDHHWAYPRCEGLQALRRCGCKQPAATSYSLPFPTQEKPSETSLQEYLHTSVLSTSLSLAPMLHQGSCNRVRNKTVPR